MMRPTEVMARAIELRLERGFMNVVNFQGIVLGREELLRLLTESLDSVAKHPDEWADLASRLDAEVARRKGLTT
jgi:hypothetical protein